MISFLPSFLNSRFLLFFFFSKSMDSTTSVGASPKRTYDMNSLLKFRQVSLDGRSNSPPGLDIATLSVSPSTKKKQRGRTGTGRSGSPPGGSRSPVSSSSWGAKNPSARAAPSLVVGENAWRPKKKDADALARDLGLMRGILNKVTAEKMDYFIGQMMGVGIGSAHHLRGLIELVFERVLSAQSMTPMYAELCFKLSSLCPVFSDPTGADTGEWSFRRLLLNRCQREFEEKAAQALRTDLSAGEALEAEFKAKVRCVFVVV